MKQYFFRFKTNKEILKAISHNARPSVIQIFEFMCKNTLHTSPPLSPNKFFHTPALFFNCGGEGLCDDVASVFVHLCKSAGHKARVIRLKNHIVAEAWNKDLSKWEMFDVDHRAYYNDDLGRKLSAIEIYNNPPSTLDKVTADCYSIKPKVAHEYNFDRGFLLQYFPPILKYVENLLLIKVTK